MDKLTNKLKKIWQKAKTIKNIEIIIGIVIICIAVLIYSSVKSKSDSVQKSSDTGTAAVAESAGGTTEEGEEARIAKLLSEISGAGNVSVMIVYDGNGKKEYAETVTENVSETADGKITETVSTPIIVSNNGVSAPVLLSETKPQIQSAVIVASGAGNVKIRLQIVNAVCALLNVDAAKVKVFEGK